MSSTTQDFRSSNPAFSDRVLQNAHTYGITDESTTMSVQGTVVKTLLALCGVLLTAGWTWIQFRDGANVFPWMIGGGLTAFIVGIATGFRPMWAQWTTPIYALAEGFLLGGLSAMIASQFPDVDIVFQACALTFATLFVMLMLYQSGVIKVTQRLRTGITVATGAIFLLYLASMVLRLFGYPIPYIHDASPIGIAFSLFVVGLAAFNLLLDFDMIDQLVAQRAPKSMEWYAAFALMVTLVWLYIEILRLLSKLNRER